MKKHPFKGLDCVNELSGVLANMDGFGLAIVEHQNYINENGDFNKYHLKKIFKYCRFDIVNKILLIYFTENKPTIKKLKELVIKEGGVSLNSLMAFIDYLHFSKYITFEENSDDRRGLIFYPTESLFNLMTELLRAFAIPYVKLMKTTMPEVNLKNYYTRYNKLLYDGLKPLNSIPYVNVFLEHDSGHAIMLKIYTEYVKSNDNFIKLSQTQLASSTSTSRTHIKHILSDAYNKGVIINHNNKVVLTSRLKCSCEEYFSLHMAIIAYCLDI